MGPVPFLHYRILPYIVVALVSVVVFLLGSPLEASFEFSRVGLEKGEYWRLITAHFAHTNSVHLILNLAGLFILYLLYGEYTKPRFYAVLFLLLALVVSCNVYLFNPELHFYVGLSGVLHGLFAWGVVQDITHKRKSAYLLLAGLFIKIMHEQLFNDTAFVANLIDARVAIDAHLYGAIGGLSIGIILYFLDSSHKNKERI
ncbi:rhombosortase [Glaciecola sp. 2405UD65-10]|uniref:rhombosortase n=1 Tax=Glaciecola sp. 2405UD65-10 TaxID=3397244 RepID=UPI003B5AAFE0